jgi:hypothetical protein
LVISTEARKRPAHYTLNRREWHDLATNYAASPW